MYLLYINELKIFQDTILTLDSFYIIMCCHLLVAMHLMWNYFLYNMVKQTPPSVQNISQTASLTLDDLLLCYIQYCSLTDTKIKYNSA